MARQHSPTAVLLRRCWDMDRGKRASMREGPLSALFRSTAELDEQGEETPAPAPEPPRAEPPRQEAPPEPERITLPERPEPPRIQRSTPAAAPEPRAYEQR